MIYDVNQTSVNNHSTRGLVLLNIVVDLLFSIIRWTVVFCHGPERLWNVQPKFFMTEEKLEKPLPLDQGKEVMKPGIQKKLSPTVKNPPHPSSCNLFLHSNVFRLNRTTKYSM